MIGELFDYIGKKVKITIINKNMDIPAGYIFSYTPAYEIEDVDLNAKDHLLIDSWDYGIDLDDIESIEVIED